MLSMHGMIITRKASSHMSLGERLQVPAMETLPKQPEQIKAEPRGVTTALHRLKESIFAPEEPTI